MKNYNFKRSYLATGILLFCFFLILQYNYRPFIYANHINDYHFADTLGSLFCVPICSFMYFSLNLNKSVYQVLSFIFLQNIALEVISLTGLYGVFDVYDVISLLLGTMFSYLILRYTYTPSLRLAPLYKTDI